MIRRRVAPYQELITPLAEIPGVDEITSWTIVGELGLDMEVFETPERVASWAALCPGNRESGGKRTSGKTRKGNRYIRRALVQVAWAVSHSKDTYLRAKFWRLAGKIGKKKAALAVAHHVLKVIFLMIRDQAHYQELGGTFYDRMDPIRTKNKLVNRLKALGLRSHAHTNSKSCPSNHFKQRGICQLVDNSGARGSCFSKEEGTRHGRQCGHNEG